MSNWVSANFASGAEGLTESKAERGVEYKHQILETNMGKTDTLYTGIPTRLRRKIAVTQ